MVMYSAKQLNIMLDSFGIIISAVLLILLMTSTDSRNRQSRLFMRIVLCNALMIVFDLFSWLCVGWGWEHALAAGRISVLISYSLSYLIIPLVAGYVCSLTGTNTKVSQYISKIMYILYGTVLMFIIVSHFNGMFYYYDHSNVYNTGEYYWLSQVFTLINISLLAVMIIYCRKSTDRSNLIYLMTYLFFPLAAAVISLINPEIELHYAATTISLIICYGGIQVRQTKQAIRLMQITLNSLKNIMDGINTSIYVIEPETCKLLFVNKWLKTFYGRENEDLTGKYCYKIFRGFDEKCSFCPFGKLEENPEQTVIWEEFLEPYGIYVRHLFCCIDWPSGEKAVLHYGIDITEIREKADLLVKLEKQERELAENRMSIMLSQIQPHFIFNSLSAIGELCIEDPQSARQAVIEFSGYLRVNLDSLSHKEPILFSREMNHAGTYLSLEKRRFENKVNVVYNIETENFSLPALTLQPIVENAVRHGISKTQKGGTITISTHETDIAYVITVTDDGAGFDVNSQPKNDGHTHIGIENVRSRLKSMSGGTLEIESTPGVGTTAVITIPKEK